MFIFSIFVEYICRDFVHLCSCVVMCMLYLFNVNRIKLYLLWIHICCCCLCDYVLVFFSVFEFCTTVFCSLMIWLPLCSSCVFPLSCTITYNLSSVNWNDFLEIGYKTVKFDKMKNGTNLTGSEHSQGLTWTKS